MHAGPHPRSWSARGFTLVEILIALMVLVFGLVSLARGLARSSQEEFDAYQRAQAKDLAHAMAERIESNGTQADRYVGDYTPAAQAQDCSVTTTVVARDRCEWTNELLAVDMRVRAIGAPMAARGCVTRSGPNVYLVAVTWQGVLRADASESVCGQDLVHREANRRVFSTTLQIAAPGIVRTASAGRIASR